MLFRPLLAAMLAVGALAPAASASAEADPGSVEFRLLEAPAERRGDPRARVYIIDHLRPGSSISRKVGVINRSGEETRISLYAGAAHVSDGEFVPLADGNDLASWTTISPSSIAVRPYDEAQAEVRIDVPQDASPGERYGVVWAQLPKSTPKAGGAVEVNRVGIRMYLSVGEGGEPASDFVIDTLTASRATNGVPVVSARVRNTGERVLDVAGSVRLADGPGGLRAGPFATERVTSIAPTEERLVDVPLDPRLPDGPWLATVTLTSGLTERTASATVRFPQGPGSSDPSEAQPVERQSLALALALAGSGLAALLVASLAIHRRRLRIADATSVKITSDGRANAFVGSSDGRS